MRRISANDRTDLQRRRLLLAGGGLALLAATSRTPLWDGGLGANPFTALLATAELGLRHVREPAEILDLFSWTRPGQEGAA